MVLGIATNWLAAGLLAFTIAFYGVVYTLWLKRRTPQNIVIGGLAGALPPLVGWAAASGAAPPNAWLMVAIIFVWTPPHFWALSLYTSGDYAKAGVPMMPVARGARSTRRQILAYSVVLALVAAGAGGDRSGRPDLPRRRRPRRRGLHGARGKAGEQPRGRRAEAARTGLYDTPPVIAPARDLFAFSIGYLFALFAALLGEHLAAVTPLHLLTSGAWS